MNNGWIIIHKRLLDWEWIDDHNTTRLFLFLLLKANFCDKNWKGVLIKRGQLITSVEKLSGLTGLSIQNVRTSLKKLKSTKELTDKPTNKYRLITINNYSDYQVTNGQINIQPTDNQQTTNGNINNINNINNKKTSKKEKMTELEWKTFWDFYGKKKDTSKSKKKFMALDKSLFPTIMGALKKQKVEWQDTETRYIPLPSTWLNNKRWEDEVVVEEKHPAELKKELAQIGEAPFMRKYGKQKLLDLTPQL